MLPLSFQWLEMGMNSDDRSLKLNRIFHKQGPHQKIKMAECTCFCGKVFETQLTKYNSGHTRSCGCLRAITSSLKLTTHGKTGSREHRAFWAMKNRCLNPKSDRYPSYGGRGILIDDEWLVFENFYRDMGDCPPGMSLDRLDVDSNYGPGKCRWASVEQQSNNKTNTIFVIFEGEKMSLTQAARRAGVDCKALRYRIKVKGMDFNEAIYDIKGVTK